MEVKGETSPSKPFWKRLTNKKAPVDEEHVVPPTDTDADAEAEKKKEEEVPGVSFFTLFRSVPLLLLEKSKANDHSDSPQHSRSSYSFSAL
jgi:hypothetical protein